MAMVRPFLSLINCEFDSEIRKEMILINWKMCIILIWNILKREAVVYQCMKFNFRVHLIDLLQILISSIAITIVIITMDCSMASPTLRDLSYFKSSLKEATNILLSCCKVLLLLVRHHCLICICRQLVASKITFISTVFLIGLSLTY